MTRSAEDDLRSILTHRSALLPSESLGDYRSLERAIRDYVNPSNLLEEVWTSELVEAEWEMRRLRLFKSDIVKFARLEALRNLLSSISDDLDGSIDDLAHRFFSNKIIKNKVMRMLAAVGLDGSAVDAEAFRLSLSEVVIIDRRLTCLAERRDEILRAIEDHRAGTAAPVRTSRTISATSGAPALEDDGQN